MTVDKDKSISIDEVNKDFSKATGIADIKGSAVILKDGKPCYLLVDIQNGTYPELSDEEKIDVVAKRILKKYRRAFEELAK